jgi:hypothetical protein
MTTSNGPAQSPGTGQRPIDGRNLEGLEPVRGEHGSLDGGGPGDPIRARVRSQIVRLGWLVLAAGLAFGSAGLVAAAQHPPSGGNRQELTWAADHDLSATLDAAVRDLTLLNDDVDLLGRMARQTLSSLAQVDQVALTQAWDSGSSAVSSIDARAADLTKRLKCDLWDAAYELELSKTYSPALIDRYHSVCLAIASVAPLRDDWVSLVAGSSTAMQVAFDINNHDQIAADALQLATQGRYQDALTKLASATAAIADATSIAADLARVTDVSTLQDWMARTTRMDSALQTLWRAMIASKGRVTPQVTAALKGVNDAKALLPDDNSVLQVVLYELAGNLTTDGISIETARGALAGALSDLVDGTVFGR